MANVKISQLTSATTLTGAEEIPVVQGSSTVKTTAQDIADLAGGASYTSYVARISGTSSISEIILSNTTGYTFTWTKSEIINYYPGYAYTATLAVPNLKIAVFISGQAILQDTGKEQSYISPNPGYEILGLGISSSRINLWYDTNGVDNGTELTVEIRIYP
jgi:hypothetical protein